MFINSRRSARSQPSWSASRRGFRKPFRPSEPAKTPEPQVARPHAQASSATSRRGSRRKSPLIPWKPLSSSCHFPWLVQLWHIMHIASMPLTQRDRAGCVSGSWHGFGKGTHASTPKVNFPVFLISNSTLPLKRQGAHGVWFYIRKSRNLYPTNY